MGSKAKVQASIECVVTQGYSVPVPCGDSRTMEFTLPMSEVGVVSPHYESFVSGETSSSSAGSSDGGGQSPGSKKTSALDSAKEGQAPSGGAAAAAASTDTSAQEKTDP